MDITSRISDIQAALRREGIDAWLFFNFRHFNGFMDTILNLDRSVTQTRRCAYLIPAEGEPVRLVHKIEAHQLDVLPGSLRAYSGWRELESHLADMVQPYKKVAMEYSPGMAIPYVSLCDAGIVEMVRGFGSEIVTSANLIQEFEAVWNEDEYASHERAAQALYDCVTATFAEVKRRVTEEGKTDEYSVQQFMVKFLESRGMIADHAPIVGVNGHAADPHYEPNAASSWDIKEGDFLLIDLWCKEANTPRAMYADITWTGYVGKEIPEKYLKVFNTVIAARDAASKFVTDSFAAGKRIRGAEVDDVCRKVIVEAGYGEFFIHRTGHSIGENVHGNGANIDNLETRDERYVVPRTCFSIEPGIYLPDDFGVRSEIDVFVDANGNVRETGQPKQAQLVAILA